jgi:hypothetical protein
MRPAIECSLDEVPLAPHPVALTVDRARPYDRRRNAGALQQDPFELRLLRRIRVVSGLDGGLRFGNRDREFREVVDALGLVERASPRVGIDGCRRDCDERAGVELEQLVGVRRFERDDVDDEVEAVGDRQRSVLAPVERDVIEARRRRPLRLAGKRDVPTVRGEGVRDCGTDVAGATENEGAPRDRSARRPRRRRRR